MDTFQNQSGPNPETDRHPSSEPEPETVLPPSSEPDNAECFLKVIALAANLILIYAVISKKPYLFLPWMVVYGFELVGGWAVGLTFLVLPGM